jgi:hypothetical protein
MKIKFVRAIINSDKVVGGCWMHDSKDCHMALSWGMVIVLLYCVFVIFLWI